MKSNNEKIVLLARQRSGTHALKSVLESHPDFHCFEEIFHADPAFRQCPENFFRYVEDRHLPASALFPWNIQQTLDAFWDHLKTLAGPARFQVLDIKYNSAHLICREWQSLNHYPALFDVIKEQGMRVVHLKRKNALRQWVSARIADRTRTWVVERQGPEPVGALQVDTEDLMWTLKGMQEEDELIWRALWDYDVLELEYCDLFLKPGGVPEDKLREISEWFGVECRFQERPTCAKQLCLPLEELIDNYAEVADTLKNSDFEWMLADEPFAERVE
jgi:LPS sulfotransferase NodH